MAKGKWKIKVNASSSDMQHVAGIGEVEPGKWVDLDEAQVAKFEAAQRTSMADVAGGVFEVKDPSGKLIEPPKEESEEEAEEEKEEDS